MLCIACFVSVMFAPAFGGTPPANTVLEFSEEAGAGWEPFHTCTGQDSMPIAWFNRRANTSYFMSAQHERMQAGTAPTLDEPPAACSGSIFSSHDAHGFDSGPQSYANFQWLQSVRVFANGTAANRGRPRPQRVQGRVRAARRVLLEALRGSQPRERERLPRSNL